MIEGIHNYCNRWCERCPFTTRCAIGRSDPHEAPAEEDTAGLTTFEPRGSSPPSIPYHEALEEPLAMWSRFYFFQARRWVDTQAAHAQSHSCPALVKNAIAVVEWNSLVGWTKLARAILAEEWNDPNDAAGSAKVARIAYTDIQSALADALPHTRDPTAHQLFEGVAHAAAEIDARFPRSRRFRRPGFDDV